MTFSYWTSFTKMKNSTLVPASAASTKTCVLKDDTNIVTPTIILQGHSYFNVSYGYISDFGRYYFVTAIRTVGPDTEIDLDCDVLATYKASITASSQLVSRCADDTYADFTLIDDMPSATMEPDVIEPIEDTNIPFYVGDDADTNHMTVILTVKSGQGSVFYAMAYGSFETLCHVLYSSSQDTLWNTLNVSALFTKTFLDPMAYITDVKLIPLQLSNVPGTMTDTIYLGYWSYTDPDQTQIFKQLSSRIVYDNISTPITIALEALQTDEDAFLNSNKFRHVTVNLPGAGNVELDADILTQGNSVTITVAIDVAGTIVYKLVYGGDHVTFTSGSIGIPIAIHSNVPNMTGLISGVGSVIGSAAGSAVAGSSLGPLGTVGGAILGTVSAIPNAIRAAGPLGITESRGSDGSIAGIFLNKAIIVNETRYKISGRGPVTNGYPCMKYLLLSNLSGYCQCVNAHISIAGTMEEKDSVDSYVNSGFYIE